MTVKFWLKLLLFFLNFCQCLQSEDDVLLQTEYWINSDDDNGKPSFHTLVIYNSNTMAIDEQIDSFCINSMILNLNFCERVRVDVLRQIGQLDSITPTSTESLPFKINTIWILWWQGWDLAPPIVLKCLESWRYHHSSLEWNIMLLDKNNIANFIDLNSIIPDNIRNSISIISISDILRWMLLYQYGGIWVDATIFCHKPISSWLNLAHKSNRSNDIDNLNKSEILSNECTSSSREHELTCIKDVNNNSDYYNCNNNNNNFHTTGFFAFTNGAFIQTKYLSFFLISIKHGYIVSKMVDYIKTYWHKRTREHFYFWQNYLFALLYDHDNKFKQNWDDIYNFPISNNINNNTELLNYYHQMTIDMHLLQNSLSNQMNMSLSQWLCHPTVPFSKLTHKYRPNDTNSEGSVYEYIIGYKFDQTCSYE